MSDSIVYVDDSPIHGKGLFAKSFIPAGMVIGVVRGNPCLLYTSDAADDLQPV